MDYKKHFYWIDWIRFIASLMVVICHSRGYNWVDWGDLSSPDHNLAIEIFFAATRAGVEWVVVFFVLSGFLVGGGVLSRCLNGIFDFKLFAIDRISRIWVPLIPALFFSLIIAWCCGLPVSVFEMLGNVFALQGIFFNNFAHNEPLWSLSYEIWFYVLIGTIGIIVTSEAKQKIAPIMILLLGFAVFTRLNPDFASCWLLGAFSYFLVSDKVKPGILILAIFLAVLGGVISQLQSDTTSLSRFSLMKFAPPRNIAMLIESTGIGLLLASTCCISPKTNIMISLDHIGSRLAAFSYTLYLTHYPVLNLWQHFLSQRSAAFTLTSFVVFCVKIISCLLFAWLFYLLFEARTIFVKKWLYKNFSNLST